MQIDIIAYLIIYRAVAVLVAGGSLVAGVLVAGGCLPGGAGGASLVPVVEVPPWWLVSSWLVAAFLVVLVVPPWFLARIFTAGHAGGARKAPQCGGALACESKLQGKFAGCDCSNYQLFRCSFRDGFYRLAFQLSL